MMTWKKHTVWIEFNDGTDPVTLTNVDHIATLSEIVSVTWLNDKKKELHTYHYPLSRIKQIRETNTYDGEYDE